MSGGTETHRVVAERIDMVASTLIGLSHRIHAAPELAFEEHQASQWITDLLADDGFEVQKPYCGLDTAFRARVGSGSLRIALCAEYDALPDIGHACGHNIIAATAVGAAMALRPVVDDLGLTVEVIGTPAEERGAGKVLLLERGGFDGVHAALMVHPGPRDLIVMPSLAVATLDVEFQGLAAHAAAFPQRGVNAADAFTVSQVAIGLLRQHLDPTVRVHGIVTEGGVAPNIVPARSAGRYHVRAVNGAALEAVRARIERCFEAGAIATGCTYRIDDHQPVLLELRPDDDLSQAYQRLGAGLGRDVRVPSAAAQRSAGSTDMGNVSHHLPAIHPMIGIDSLPAVPHQPGFADASISASGDRAVVDGSRLLAGVAVVASQGSLRSRLVDVVR